MPDLALRVAARFLTSPQGAVEKTAGFIPDKFWKAKAAELKALLKRPLKAKEPYEIAYQINEELIPFFEKFVKELKGFGLSREAEESVDNRLDNVKHVYTKFDEAYREFDLQLNKGAPYPIRDVEGEIRFAVMVRVRSYFEESVTTLADALKAMWKTDASLIIGLADRLLKKMTPDVYEAVDRSRQGDYGHATDLKWKWLDAQRLEAQAKRLVTKEKVTYDPFQWMSFLKEVLVANYSDKAEAVVNGDRFREFDLNGMKVVVDDVTVTDGQIREYVHHLDAAFNLLRNKRLSKAWYGTVFIQCESCGGENPNGPQFGVGGHYGIGPNTVSIFVRPSKFIVELMAHELGHRFWFKDMSSTQRARFESLVKVHSLRPPETVFKDQSVSWVRQNFRKWFETLRDHLVRYAQVESFNPAFPQPMEWINDLRDRGQKVTQSVDNMLLTNPKTSPPYVKKLHDDVLMKGSALSGILQTVAPLLDTVKGSDEQHKAAREKYVDRALKALLDLEDSFDTYLKRGPEEWKEERNRQFAEDGRPVTPVSTYGESNIDEAFAEVFAHYVLEYNITRDQLESFRSVLSSEGIEQRVLRRFLASGGAENLDEPASGHEPQVPYEGLP